MIRGLMIRTICFLLGVFPLTGILHALDISSELAGLTAILYVAAGANYLAHYCVKHQDEIPTRPERP